MSAETLRLLDAWLAPAEAGEPVACLATTFTFDPDFFEEECLARFLSLDSAVLSDSGPADAAYYVVQREEALEEARATVLVDRAQASAATSHRWDVIPTGAPQGGVQHAKVAVLIWQNVARLIVGSANLTRAGHRSNIEAFCAFDWPSSERVGHLLVAAADFLEVLLDRHTTGQAVQASPRGRARQTVEALRERVIAEDVRPAGRREAQVELVHTLRDGTLLDQAFDACWRGGPPSAATVVSPYFVSRTGGPERRPGGSTRFVGGCPDAVACGAKSPSPRSSCRTTRSGSRHPRRSWSRWAAERSRYRCGSDRRRRAIAPFTPRSSRGSEMTGL